MKRTKWIERKFGIIEDNGLLPAIIERLEGTPVRLQKKIKNIDEDKLNKKSDGKWSIKEEIGHLSDLEPLWIERVEQIVIGLPEMKPADITNPQTHNANHNSKNVLDILNKFALLRNQLVERLRTFHDDDLLKASIHPRLKTPMKIIDLAFFVAEHDDHHLAQIHFLITSN